MINSFKIDLLKFSLKKEYFEIQSWLHGIGHTYRVMCNCLVLGDRIGNERETRLAFCGAFIHDMSRQHDGFCTEHGLWAANQKLNQFRDLFLETGMNIEDLEEIKTAVTNHSVHPDISINHPSYTTTAILKDADALDRIRMGRFNLNKKFLRFRESIELVDFAKNLYYKSRSIENPDFQAVLTIGEEIL